MARKNDKKTVKKDDWRSRFVYLQFSHNDELEIAEHAKRKGVSGLSDLVEVILDSGGSAKFSYNSNDGSIFVTLATDGTHSDYGGFSFGFRYPTILGAVAIADWVWHCLLQTDRGCKYLPTTLDDWLNLG